MSHHNNRVPVAQTFILSGYRIPCDATVIAWEFCYQRSDIPSVKFFPSIWRLKNNIDVTNYELVNSSDVTYYPSNATNMYHCQVFNLSDADQFTAPAESVVGLFSNDHTHLLHTNASSLLVTYHIAGRHASIISTDNVDDVDYNISIRVHLGK